MSYLHTLLISASLFLGTLHADEIPHKIIYMISPPRSLSTAFMRMIEARGDFEIFHEPSAYAFINTHFASPEFEEIFNQETHRTFKEVKEQLLSAALEKPVFVKEISTAAASFLMNEPEFFQNENIHFVFLLRNPHPTMVSFYKKLGGCMPNWSYLLGFEPLYTIFDTIKTSAKNKPVVVFSEDLYNRPEETISALCAALGISFIPESLHWEPLTESFGGEKNWHELKNLETVQIWHGDAIRSCKFSPPTQYAVDEQGLPTFEEIANAEDKETCFQAYLENLPFYKCLQEEKEYQLFY